MQRSEKVGAWIMFLTFGMAVIIGLTDGYIWPSKGTNRPLVALADEYVRQCEYGMALVAYEDAIELQQMPNANLSWRVSRNYLNAGACYSAMGDPIRALAYWQAALVCSPKFRETIRRNVEHLVERYKR